MSFCITCGVKISDRHTNCPLCNRPIEYTSKRENLPPLYPEEVNKITIIKPQTTIKDWVVIHFYMFFTFLIVLSTTGIDYTLNKGFTWSSYSTVSALFIYSIISSVIHLRRNPYILYATINLLIPIFLFSLDWLTQRDAWFIDKALPSFITLQVISLVVYILFKIILLKLQRAVTIIIATNLLIITIDQITSGTVTWSILCTALLLPTAIYIMILSAKLQSSYYLHQTID